jgi:hypothetical protein
MNKIVVGHFEADGGLIYLPIGFKPDYFRMVDYHTDTNIIVYEWWGRMEDDQASGKKEGISYTEGVTANLADDGGFAAYDTGAQKSIDDWAASTAYVVNDLVKPTSSGTDDNGLTCDRSAIYKCVTAGTSDSSEPVWPSAFETDGPSDNGVVWQRVGDEAVYRYGYQGVRIDDALMTDGQEVYYMAILADAVRDHGDVAGWSGGIYGS